ncbi:hypothetical protein HYH02_002553 [Chlamydomonas schloesseri]|uniref:Uncharacterized protein n=1 Tax=Chlamydomonas schloesseri TaxID=2026947 RepID=A0A836BBT3_9CHLO|nr:hypothetical protein HYH02_002553 [Chlamydomonas schloesseri]|eukprot:KAG2453230.1 hypothetical protein HYH02_002553 [Chlamydomonas schloesseri]
MSVPELVTNHDSDNYFARLTPELIQAVAQHAHPNDAFSLKLVGTEAAAALRAEYQTLVLGLRRRDYNEPHRARLPWHGQAFVAHWGRPEPWRALTLPQRERLLCLAASGGHAPSLDAALAHSGCALKPDVLTSAAAAGNLAGCERLLAEGCSFSLACLAAAAEGGHLHVLQQLLETLGARLPDCTSAAARGACKGGHLPIYAWLQQMHGHCGSPDDALTAARAGHVPLLDYLLRRSGIPGLAPLTDTCTPVAQRRSAVPAQLRRALLEAIVTGCPLEALQAYYESLCEPGEAGDFLGPAAGSPTPCWRAKVDWLLRTCGPRRAGMLLRSYGSLVAEYEHVDDDRLADLPPIHARMKGLLDIVAAQPDFLARLQHLHATGLELGAGSTACRAAARGGHADALAWLWDECGVEPSAASVLDAALAAVRAAGSSCGSGEGHLAVLRLLRERGFVFRPEHVLQLTRRARRCVRPEGLHRVELDADACSGLEAALLWLAGAASEDGLQEGAQAWCWSEAFQDAARRGVGLPLLKALRARGAVIDLAAVAVGGGVEALEWASAPEQADYWRVAAKDSDSDNDNEHGPASYRRNKGHPREEPGAGSSLRGAYAESHRFPGEPEPIVRLYGRWGRSVTLARVLESGNAAALAWLLARGCQPLSRGRQGLAAIAESSRPDYFWRLQLWAQAQVLLAQAARGLLLVVPPEGRRPAWVPRGAWQPRGGTATAAGAQQAAAPQVRGGSGLPGSRYSHASRIPDAVLLQPQHQPPPHALRSSGPPGDGAQAAAAGLPLRPARGGAAGCGCGWGWGWGRGWGWGSSRTAAVSAGAPGQPWAPMPAPAAPLYWPTGPAAGVAAGAAAAAGGGDSHGSGGGGDDDVWLRAADALACVARGRCNGADQQHQQEGGGDAAAGRTRGLGLDSMVVGGVGAPVAAAAAAAAAAGGCGAESLDGVVALPHQCACLLRQHQRQNVAAAW